MTTIVPCKVHAFQSGFELHCQKIAGCVQAENLSTTKSSKLQFCPWSIRENVTVNLLRDVVFWQVYAFSKGLTRFIHVEILKLGMVSSALK